MSILMAQDFRDYDQIRKAFNGTNSDGDIFPTYNTDVYYSLPDENGRAEYTYAEYRFIEEVFPDYHFRTYQMHSASQVSYCMRVAAESDSIKKGAVSFIFGGPISITTSGTFGFMVALSKGKVGTGPTNNADVDSFNKSGLSVRCGPDGVISVVSSVATSNTSVNELVIATGPTIRPNEFYLFDVMWDISSSLAKCEVYINGLQAINATFDRDRIVNAFSDTQFEFVKFSHIGGNRRKISIANIVVYTPDAITPFPLGPLEIGRISPTSGPEYELVDYDPNASDGGWHVVPPGSEAIWKLGEIPPGNPVLFAEMRGRIAAGGGFTPAVMDIELQRSGGSISAAVVSESPAASHERQFRVKIPDADTNIETLNGARIAVRARTEN